MILTSRAARESITKASLTPARASSAAQASLQQPWHALTIMSFHQMHNFLTSGLFGVPAGLSCQVLAIATSGQPQPHVPPAKAGSGWLSSVCGLLLPSPLLCLCQQLLVRAEVLPHCLPQFVSPVQSLVPMVLRRSQSGG